MKHDRLIRRITLAAAGLLAAAVLAGCSAASSAGGASASQGTSRSASASSAGSASASQATSQPAPAASSAQGDAAPRTFDGAFAAQGEYTEEEYRPLLTLEPDGSANLRENLLEGMGNFTGHYTVSDGTLTVTVDSVDFAESFVCYSVREITFTVQDEDTLVLQTELCASVPGAVFARA